jgi:hypothetical protein
MTKQRRLMIFPCETGKPDGYSIAVTADVARLAPRPEDLVIFRVQHATAPQGNMRTIGTPSASDKARNILTGRPPYEVSEAQLRQCLQGIEGSFDEIFAGEIFFYKALRKIYPSAHIYARSHNFYSLARCRQLLGNHPSNLRHALNLNLYSKLEMELLADKKVTLIFITEEELAFARLLSPMMRGECWSVIDPNLKVREDLRPPTVPRLVFLGSAAASHTAIGLEVLCHRVLPQLREKLPQVEFHLFGHGTEVFGDVAKGIHGHGRYPGDGLPFEGDGLFCVPDVHGCGIKMKVADLVKAGAPFISTPLGMSGYHLPDHPHILVRDMDDWAEAIHDYFRSLGLVQPFGDPKA